MPSLHNTSPPRVLADSTTCANSVICRIRHGFHSLLFRQRNTETSHDKPLTITSIIISCSTQQTAVEVRTESLRAVLKTYPGGFIIEFCPICLVLLFYVCYRINGCVAYILNDGTKSVWRIKTWSEGSGFLFSQRISQKTEFCKFIHGWRTENPFWSKQCSTQKSFEVSQVISGTWIPLDTFTFAKPIRCDLPFPQGTCTR